MANLMSLIKVKKYRYLALALIVILYFGVGRRDSSLSPTASSEVVTVTVKVPDQLEAEIMQVIYRSTRCTHTRSTASGKTYQRDGFQNMQVQPVRQGQSDIYEARLPIDGGGDCRWKLSNVTFGVKYADPKYFGSDVRGEAGAGVVVMFDKNNSPHGGAAFKVDGDLIIKKDYYPWLSENFIGGHRKDISMASDVRIYLMYQALQAKNIYFEPVLHHRFLVRSVQPSKKEEGVYTSFTYPDGEVVADGRASPNFRKLQAIRMRVEGSQ